MTSRTPQSLPTSSGQDELDRLIDSIKLEEYAVSNRWQNELRLTEESKRQLKSAIAHHTQEAVEAAYFRGLAKEQRSHKYNAGDVCKNCGVGGEDGAEYGEYWSCEQVRMARKLAALASTNQPKLNQGESDASSKS